MMVLMYPELLLRRLPMNDASALRTPRVRICPALQISYIAAALLWVGRSTADAASLRFESLAVRSYRYGHLQALSPELSPYSTQRRMPTAKSFSTMRSQRIASYCMQTQLRSVVDANTCAAPSWLEPHFLL